MDRPPIYLSDSRDGEEGRVAVLDELAVDARVFGELAADLVYEVVDLERVERDLVWPYPDQWTWRFHQD